MISFRRQLYGLISLSAVLVSAATTSATTETAGNTAGGATIPAPSRTIYVSSSSQLSKAISKAVAGDHIVLTNGTYSGFTIDRSGQSEKPIVIRAANLHAAKFSGSISIAGSYVWLIGMDMGSRGISILGAHNRVSRNIFKSSVVNAIFAERTSRNAEIDHNEHAGGTISGGNFDSILIKYQCSQQAAHYVHHNYLHDGGGKNSDALSSGLGTSCRGLAPEAGSLFEYNLVANWHAGACISVKSSSNTFRFNTCLGNKDEGPRNRFGRNNQYIANWLEGVTQLRIYDGYNTVIGNKVIAGRIRIGSGNLAVGDPDAPGYIAANETIVAGNDGELEIGTNFSDYNSKPATNTRVEAHITGGRCQAGRIRCSNHVGTTFSAETDRTLPKAFKLTVSQVGPFAPTAPKL
jgi:hypothetical protein